MHFVCISNTFFFKVIPVLVAARWTDFVHVFLLWLSNCSVVFCKYSYMWIIHKNSNSVGCCFFFFASLPKFGEEVLQIGNRPLTLVVISTHVRSYISKLFFSIIVHLYSIFLYSNWMFFHSHTIFRYLCLIVTHQWEMTTSNNIYSDILETQHFVSIVFFI